MERTVADVAGLTQNSGAATNSGERAGPRPCRYGLACYRADCYYAHPQGRVVDPSQAGARFQGGAAPSSNNNPRQTTCRYDTQCMRPDCHFQHPNGRALDSGAVPPSTGGNPSGKSRGSGSGQQGQRTPCRYGDNCRMVHCKFYHKDRRPGYSASGSNQSRGNSNSALPFGVGGRSNGPRQPQLAKSAYADKDLKQREDRGFRGAGVLPYRKSEDKISVLMGLEKRGYTEVLCLNFLGGSRIRNEAGPEAATRIFNERTGQVLDEATIKHLGEALRSGKDRQVMWVPNVKYALYLYEVTADNTADAAILDIPAKFSAKAATTTSTTSTTTTTPSADAASAAASATSSTESADATPSGEGAQQQQSQKSSQQQQVVNAVESLVWIPLEDILQAVGERRDHILLGERKINFFSFVVNVFADAAFGQLTPFTAIAPLAAPAAAASTSSPTTSTTTASPSSDAAPAAAKQDAAAPAADSEKEKSATDEAKQQ